MSVIIPILILLLIVGLSKSGGESLGIVTPTVCLSAIAAYGFIGWLLCSFVNGRLIKSCSEFNLTDKKPQTLFLKKY